MEKPYYVVIDLETTGTDPNIHEIIDVAMIVLDDKFDVIDRLYIKAFAELLDNATNEALSITGYDEYIWDHNNAVSQSLLRSNIINFLSKISKGNRLIPIGHGIKHDLDFLYTYDIGNLINYNVFIDLVSVEILLSISAGNQPEIHSLSTLCNIYNINLDRQDGIHTAHADAEATMEIFRIQRDILCSILVY